MIGPRRMSEDFERAIELTLNAAQATSLKHVFWFANHYYWSSPTLGDLPTISPECGWDRVPSGWSLVHPTNTLIEARARYLQGHFLGDATLPRWVTDGVQLRLKATPAVRRDGLRTTVGSHSGDDRAWPKEIGTITRREGNGWWDWGIAFERGRWVAGDVDLAMLKNFARVTSDT